VNGFNRFPVKGFCGGRMAEVVAMDVDCSGGSGCSGASLKSVSSSFSVSSPPSKLSEGCLVRVVTFGDTTVLDVNVESGIQRDGSVRVF
jgi:hypothetical protein